MTETYTLYMHKFPNNKLYVGITCRPVEVRWQNKYNKYFSNAVHKYGWENIEHIVLADKLRQANLGKHHTEETKQKISVSRKGKPGKPLSEETKRKISETLKEKNRRTKEN